MLKHAFSQCLCLSFQCCVYLPLLIDPDDPGCALVSGRDEDGFSADAVHVNTHARLQIIHVEIPVFSDEVDDAVLRADL